VKQVEDVLRAEFTEEPTNWSRRYKANLEKLASGDVVESFLRLCATFGVAIKTAVSQPVKSAC
jgi:hypothetical protein